jgi:hypothetical protein
MMRRGADQGPLPFTKPVGWRAIGFLSGGVLLIVFGVPLMTFGPSDAELLLSFVPAIVGLVLIVVGIGYSMIWLVRRAPPMR